MEQTPLLREAGRCGTARWRAPSPHNPVQRARTPCGRAGTNPNDVVGSNWPQKGVSGQSTIGRAMERDRERATTDRKIMSVCQSCESTKADRSCESTKADRSCESTKADRSCESTKVDV